MHHLTGWFWIRHFKRSRHTGHKIHYPDKWSSKNVKLTFEKIIIGCKNPLKTTPKQHQKSKTRSRLDMKKQQFLYNSDANLHKILQAN